MSDRTPLAIEIHTPDAAAIEEAYRALPQFGEARITFRVSSLFQILDILEEQGFCGMQISGFSAASDPYCNVRAYKGKRGPCFDGGHTAQYRGAGCAVLDDDNHLLLNTEALPICIKTAHIYMLPSYRHVVSITTTEAIKAENTLEPVPFDCDDFGDQLEKLRGMLASSEPETARTALFYPGPFRKLLLQDGTVVERGRLNSVPVSDAKALVERDLCFSAGSLVCADPVWFRDAYDQRGALCLLEKSYGVQLIEQSDRVDFSALHTVQRAFSERLVSMIRSEKTYLVLTGSDPENKLGCCPSDAIGEANRLVKAGVMEALRHPAPPDACPVTTYAFRGEIRNIEGEIQMEIHPAVRDKVLMHINSAKHPQYKNIVKWTLLIVLMVTTAFAIAQLSGLVFQEGGSMGKGVLVPNQKNEIKILLFHNTQRCAQCTNMEQHIDALMQSERLTEITRRPFRFQLVNMNAPQNRALVDQFGIYTATPVIVEFKDGRLSRTAVLYDAWKVHQSPEAFKEMFVNTLRDLIVANDG